MRRVFEMQLNLKSNIMKFFLILLSTLLMMSSAGVNAQIVNPTYTVTRQDLFVHGSIGHAHTNATVKLGKPLMASPSIPQTFLSDSIMTKTIVVNGVGALKAQVVFTSPSPDSTMWFDLPTVAGDYRTSSVVTYYPLEYPFVPCYGYSARFNLTAANTYKFSVTRFECIGKGMEPMSKIQEFNNSKPALYPNPSNGLSEIEYKGINGEEMRLTVTDMSGRLIQVYQTTLNTGINRLAVNIQNEAAGTYLIKWETNTGNNGVFRMIKK